MSDDRAFRSAIEGAGNSFFPLSQERPQSRSEKAAHSKWRVTLAFAERNVLADSKNIHPRAHDYRGCS